MTQTLQVCDLHGKQWHDRGQCERCREEADLTVFSTKDLDKLRERVMMTGPELVAAAPSAELLADLISGKARAEDTSHYVREHVCEPEEKPDGWTGTWCPQCGEGVGCDEEGLCNSCGATCVGEGVEAALKCKRELEVIAKDLDDLGVQRSTTPMDGGEPAPYPRGAGSCS